MEKIKQNTNCRRWASLWLVMAMAVMTAIFLRGGVVVQAEENSISSVKTYINDRQTDFIDNVKKGRTYILKVEPISDNKDVTYTYSWYMYDNGKRKDLGKNSSELKVTKTENRYEYYYVDIVSNDGSKKSKTFSLYGKEESNFSFLAYVNGEYKSFGDGDYAVHCTIESEKKIELYVDAKEISGKDITYQWEKGSSETGTEIIVGATEATYIAPQLESDTDTYTCIVSCDGDSQGCTFYLNKKGSGNQNYLDVSKYVMVNDVEAKDKWGTIYVDKGDKVTFGIDVSDFPEDIKEEDISYKWYDTTEGVDCVCEKKEYTIASISQPTECTCILMANGKPLMGGNVQFHIDINPDITTEVFVDDEKVDDDSFGVDSFEELYNKKVMIKAKDKTNPDAKFDYEWFKVDENGEEKSISKNSECTLLKELLSESNINLYCIIKNEEGYNQRVDLNLYVYDYSDSADKYINDEKVNSEGEGQFKTGDKVTVEIKFPDDIASKMRYQWYDEDYRKQDCQKSEYTIIKGIGEEIYRCIVTDQYDREMTYDFILYPETKLVPQRYLNNKKVISPYCPVAPGTIADIGIKVNSTDNISYQWYKGEYTNKKELKGEIKANLSVKVSKNSGEEDDYSCLVTRGNERKWVYFWVVSCDHSEVEVLPAVPATCEKDGLTEGKRCKECGETIVEQEVVKATGHKWDNGTVTKPATATETGVKTFTCTVCKKTKTEVIQKLTTNNTVNNDTTKKSETIETSLKTGTKVTDKKSKAVYKVTGDNTVQYTKASGKKVRKAKKVAIPAAVTVNGVKYQVTAIAPNAFKNNKNLKTIIIPATVRSIGKQAFAGCKNLKSIVIRTPYLTKKSVGAKAFKGISSKAVIKVPKKQLKAYKKLLKTKGVAKSVKIK